LSINAIETLTQHGIHPSAHRVAVAQYVLTTHDHPSADRVLDRVRDRFPMISRATVYNTLNLFVEKGLLRVLHLAEDSVVFDPKLERHHHLIDDETGQIHDIAWNKVEIKNIKSISNYDINEYQVVMHGRRRKK
jgi:Fe2+ or Zn2+ uptake regulation protein